MNEAFLQYIWQQNLFTPKVYQSSSGEEIEVIDPGTLNTDAGPDFFNGKVKINGTVWAGNIEIHLNSSDWKKHNHHTDPAYNNVILQVVLKANEETFTSKDNRVPTIEVSVPQNLMENYTKLLSNKKWVPCNDNISIVDAFTKGLLIEKLGVERIENKTSHINQLLDKNKNDWNNTFYQVLARSFGFGINSQAFEQLAISLPIAILAKHTNNITDIEALLYGQSGILELQEKNTPYVKTLQETYKHLKNKYQLTAIDASQWKFLRLRPVNFPTVRIAQFAALIVNSSHLLSKALEVEQLENLYNLLQASPGKYWQTHYHFGKESKVKNKVLGKASVQGIIINAIVPFLYLYGQLNNKEGIKNRAFEILNELPKENNSIVRKWQTLGFELDNSFHSQAVIQLKTAYCDKKECLRCTIGHQIINLKNEKTF